MHVECIVQTLWVSWKQDVREYPSMEEAMRNVTALYVDVVQVSVGVHKGL